MLLNHQSIKKLLSLCAGVLSVTFAVAQESNLKNAEMYYMQMHYYDQAISYFEKAIKTEAYEPDVFVKLGDCYYYTNQLKKAAESYQKSFDKLQAPRIEWILNYGHTLRALGQYDNAIAVYAKASELDPKASKNYIEATEFARSNTAPNPMFDVTLQSVNSDAADFAPAFFGKEVLFTSLRKSKMTSTLEDIPSELYAAERVAKNDLKLVGSLRGDLTKYNEGPVTFSVDNKFVYASNGTFRSGIRLPYTDLSLNITISSVQSRSSWSDMTYFSGNDADFSTGYADLSADGNKLLFASNRDGGYGGYDIYECTRINGKWSAPKNLGAGINTPGNDISPSYTAGNAIFFSSDWHAGFGGFDIFKATKDQGKWKKLENLGQPVNSPYDDFCYIYDDNAKVGYFTSNRPGGKGMEDIYKAIHHEETLEMPVEAEVKSKLPEMPGKTEVGDLVKKGADDIKKAVIRKAYLGQVVSAVTNKPMESVAVTAKDAQGGTPITGKTNARGEFTFSLSAGEPYTFTFVAKGYDKLEKIITAPLDNPMLGRMVMNLPGTISIDKSTPDKAPGKELPKEYEMKVSKSPTPPIGDHGYVIRVGAFKSVEKEKLDFLSQYGNIMMEKNKDLTIYQLGIYVEESQAKEILPNVKKEFKDAWVRTYDYDTTTLKSKLALGSKLIYPKPKKIDLSKTPDQAPIDKQKIRNNADVLTPKGVVKKDEPKQTPEKPVEYDNIPKDKLPAKPEDIKKVAPEVVKEQPPKKVEETPKKPVTPPAPKEKGIVYKVQLGAFAKVQEGGQFDNVASLGDVDIVVGDNSKVYYYLGSYKTVDQARTAQQKASLAGHTQSFVVAFKDGKKIPLKDAVGSK